MRPRTLQQVAIRLLVSLFLLLGTTPALASPAAQAAARTQATAAALTLDIKVTVENCNLVIDTTNISSRSIPLVLVTANGPSLAYAALWGFNPNEHFVKTLSVRSGGTFTVKLSAVLGSGSVTKTATVPGSCAPQTRPTVMVVSVTGPEASEQSCLVTLKFNSVSDVSLTVTNLLTGASHTISGLPSAASGRAFQLGGYPTGDYSIVVTNQAGVSSVPAAFTMPVGCDVV